MDRDPMFDQYENFRPMLEDDIRLPKRLGQAGPEDELLQSLDLLDRCLAESSNPSDEIVAMLNSAYPDAFAVGVACLLLTRAGPRRFGAAWHRIYRGDAPDFNGSTSWSGSTLLAGALCLTQRDFPVAFHHYLSAYFSDEKLTIFRDYAELDRPSPESFNPNTKHLRALVAAYRLHPKANPVIGHLIAGHVDLGVYEKVEEGLFQGLVIGPEDSGIGTWIDGMREAFRLSGRDICVG